MTHYLESIVNLCFETTEENDVETKVQEYIKNFPHLRNPASLDLLRQAVKTWIRLKELETLLEQATDAKQQSVLLSRIDSMTKTWLQMLGSLGVTFTKQSYISKKTVQPPLDRLRMLKKKKEGE